MTASRATLIGLFLLGLINVGRGCVHVFLPDGGAGVIAGFDLTHERQTILFLFAALGTGQIATGLIDFAVALKWRVFAVPLLMVETLRAALFTVVSTLWKSPPIPVPGERFVIVLGAVLGILLIWELVRRRNPETTAP